jgi:tRNA(adenine34) deaminase
MCGGAAYWTQLKKVVYGAKDEKRGFSSLSENILHPKTEIESGLLQEECSKLLYDFFKNKR